VPAEQLADGKLELDYPADAVARLRITNPDRRNALDHAILDAIAAAMPTLDRGIEVRCVVLTGSEGMFSAGYDIVGIAEETFATEAEALVAHPFHAAIEAVAAHPYPVIAAVNGHCLGGGLELALSCDLRLAQRGAKLGMPPAKLGLIYSHTGLMRFISAIGVPRTKELFLLGRNVDADRAESIGLVNDVVEPDEIEDAAVALAAEIAGNAPLSLRGNKRAIDTLDGFARLTPEQERDLIELRQSCFTSEDLREGIQAFGQKRKPVWQGR
jgi:enoyl-CoA hydratase/carnithine racemase